VYHQKRLDKEKTHTSERRKNYSPKTFSWWKVRRWSLLLVLILPAGRQAMGMFWRLKSLKVARKKLFRGR